LVYSEKNKKKNTIFFDKKTYKLIGWLIEDEFKNKIYFSLTIDKVNTEIDEKNFKIPLAN